MSDAKVSFSGGIARINNLNASSQTLTTGTSGTDFNISSSLSTHTFNIPTASATNRGLLSSADWSNFNSKVPSTRTITINGNTQDLSADRSWTIITIVNWTEAFSSATQATSSWTPNNAAANVNAAIVPKGTGALLAQIPDGTATGGNARGTYAVDFQLERNNANQVAAGASTFIFGGIRNRIASSETRASIFGGEDNVINGGGRWGNVMLGGTRNQITGAHDNTCIGGTDNVMSGSAQSSFLGGGSSNTVSGLRANVIGGTTNTSSNSYATITGGQSNTASGQHSFVGGGQNNTASQIYSSVVGGLSNSVSGLYTFIGGGANNSATGSYSSILGGLQGTASLYGQQAHASGRFAANGDAQAHELIWRKSITGQNQATLALDGGSTQAILPSTNCLWNGIISVAAICTDAGNGMTIVGDAYAAHYTVTIKRIGTITSLVGTVQEITSPNADASMASCAFVIEGYDPNESLRITFIPPAGTGSTTVIRTVATFRGLQIQY